MAYPPMIEYNGAVQHPKQSFFDAELKQGTAETNNLGLPLVMSGGFALTYTLTTPKRKFAVRCFHRDIPSVEQKYDLISKKLRALRSSYFVEFHFHNPGIKVQQHNYPIVKMDWVDGHPLGVWLDKNSSNGNALQKARAEFRTIASFLEKEGMAHGDIQNGNVMMSPSGVKLIDYDGMFVPGMTLGNGSEVGHKHFQHPNRSAVDFGPKMDRFSFIALDLSLTALMEDKTLHSKFREGGETIIFTANDFADPGNSRIFQILQGNASLADQARNFAAICTADISAVPSLDDFLNARKIPATKRRIEVTSSLVRPAVYIGPFPVLDALDFQAAARHVGDKVELIGQIVEVKEDYGRRGRGKNNPFVFINFGPWRGKIVKISIWSEGLSKLTRKPTKTWVGQWVSVTGLVDPPYISSRYGYTHLSVTVLEDGQIQTLDEKQARFRLDSTSKTGKRTKTADAGTKDKAKENGATGAAIGATATTTITKGTTNNQDILKKFTTQPGAPTQPVGTGQTAPAPVQNPTAHVGAVGQGSPVGQSLGERIPGWVWLAAAALVVFVIANGGRQEQPPKPTPSNVTVPPPSAAPQKSPPGAQVPQRPSGQPMPSLNLSYRNDALQVQRRLIELGFLKGFFSDGNWGPTSQQALVEFKKQAGIGNGGNWDSTTQRALFSDQAVHARPGQQ
jgi:hypothetical protein